MKFVGSWPQQVTQHPPDVDIFKWGCFKSLNFTHDHHRSYHFSRVEHSWVNLWSTKKTQQNCWLAGDFPLMMQHIIGLNYLSNTYPRWDIYQNAHHQGTWRVLIHLQVEIISCWPSRVRFVQRATSQRNQQVEKSYTKKKTLSWLKHMINLDKQKQLLVKPCKTIISIDKYSQFLLLKVDLVLDHRTTWSSHLWWEFFNLTIPGKAQKWWTSTRIHGKNGCLWMFMVDWYQTIVWDI